MSQVPPPAAGYPTPPPAGVGKPQGLALTSLILGIASFVLCFIPIGPVPLGLFSAIAAIVVGFMARKAIARGEQGGEGLAKAGIILGFVNLALSILMIILVSAGLGLLWFLGNKAAEEAERQQREGGGTTTAPEPVEMFRMTFDCAATVVRFLLTR
jgi:hypothetical protein